MLVYGHLEYRERLSSFRAHLAIRAVRTQPDDLEQLRTLLVQIGQLEQAVEDFESGRHPGERTLAAKARELTDLAAAAFLGVWRETCQVGFGPTHEFKAALGKLTSCLSAFHLTSDPLLTIRIPEGFEFYALFPEQYCEAALHWLRDHSAANPRRAAVVGVRSIGTTLSALVAGVLRSVGWQVERCTVRPEGHPFTRTVGLKEIRLSGSGQALVVDEGPGLSGSSMAATAEALARVGFRNLSFFPGHAGEPGNAASAEVRRWWAETPKYWTPLESLRWNGLALTETLAAHAEALTARSGKAVPASSRTPPHVYSSRDQAGLISGWKTQNVARPDVGGMDAAVQFSGPPPINAPLGDIEDLSAGLWRRRVFGSEADWPVALARFERMKFRCSTRSGTFILWKFTGLGCQWEGGRTASELAENAARTSGNLVVRPLASACGFAAFPWIDGTRLRCRDAADPKLLKHLGQYLLASAGPVLPATESQAGVSRLQEMLYCNVKEALGDSVATRCQDWGDSALTLEPTPTYTDGRMAPYEWVRTEAGQILKTDFFGHELDHTLVGRQSLLWDVAGALVEWDLSLGVAQPMLQPLREAGIRLNMPALRFYQMAYAAFRMGMTSLCAGQSPADTAETNRLERAAAAYRHMLQRLLNASPPRSQETSDWPEAPARSIG